MSTITVFTPETAEYASRLLDAGFTVYLPRSTKLGPSSWFHYSREIDGQVCYGTFSGPSRTNFGEASHTMPITPSRLNGSEAVIGGRWGDDATLGIDDLDPFSVEYARAVARPSNWCPFNAEPTREAVEATERAYLRHRGTPQRFYQGARLANAKPWGIGEHYLPAQL